MRVNPRLVTPEYRTRREDAPPPPPPERLFHATVALSKILAEGFRPRSRTRKSGLGGGDSNSISFTGTFDVACNIAQAVYEIALVARGAISWDTLLGWAARDNALARARYLYVYVHGRRLQGEPDQEVFDRTVAGWRLQEARGMGGVWELPKGAMLHPHASSWKDARGRDRRRYWLRRVTPEEDLQNKLDFYRVYLTAAEEAKQRYNPVFWDANVGYFSALNLADIGVIEAMLTVATPMQTAPYKFRRGWEPPIPPGGYTYHVAEDEFRVYDLAALRVVGPVDCQLDAWVKFGTYKYELVFQYRKEPLTARDDDEARVEAYKVVSRTDEDAELTRDGVLIAQFSAWRNGRVDEYDAEGRRIDPNYTARRNVGSRGKIDEALALVKQRAADAGYYIDQLTWDFCDQADDENSQADRQRMHSLHRNGVICVAHAAANLPMRNLIPLFAHEASHIILASRPDHSEGEADRLAERLIGEPIAYDKKAIQTTGAGVPRGEALRRYRKQQKS